jgi:hypothetical protein
MALLDRFDPPAHLADFDAIPSQLDQWHQFVSGWFDAIIEYERTQVGAGDPVQFYNPAAVDPGGTVLEQAITWNAFPKELLRRFGRDQALIEADRMYPLTAYSGAISGPVAERTFYRPHDEYCEWHVQREQDTQRITAVTFTSEPPEYWYALFGGNVLGDSGVAFTGDTQRLLQLYQTFVSPEVRLDDLIATETITTARGEVLMQAGAYNIYNKWNTTLGAMHLSSPPNSLIAEIQLGADATILRQDGHSRPVVNPDALICCSAYGGPDRNSDPTIGAAVNALARLGAFVTLRNPVGLYMDHIDLSGWATPDQSDVRDWVHVVRGTPRMIERLLVEAPEDSRAKGYTVSDLTIGSVPVQYGGQIAECITVKLIGQASALGRVTNTPVDCAATCFIDPSYPITADRFVYRPGTRAIYDFGISARPGAAAALAVAAPTPNVPPGRRRAR